MTTKTKIPATTFSMLSVASIAPHPRNIRRSNGSQAEMEEMAASIREAGIIEPLIVAASIRGSADWRYTLIAGHRRLIGAVDADLQVVPCIIRHDLDTEAKQREVMLIENDHRRGLSVTEQADGYQALMTFPGYTPAVIGKRLGRTRAFVEGRLSLAALPERARDGVDHGQISIADALELAAFADPETVATLSTYVGTRDWAWRLNEAKGDLERRALADADAAKCAEASAGSEPVDQPAQSTTASDRPDHTPEVIPEGRTARAALLRTLDTAARVRHEHLATVIAAGDTDTALTIARARVAAAADGMFSDPAVVGRVLGAAYARTIKTMTLAQAVIALDILGGLRRDEDLAHSASAWRQSYTSGWRHALTDAYGYQWSPAELELLSEGR